MVVITATKTFVHYAPSSDSGGAGCAGTVSVIWCKSKSNGTDNKEYEALRMHYASTAQPLSRNSKVLTRGHENLFYAVCFERVTGVKSPLRMIIEFSVHRNSRYECEPP